MDCAQPAPRKALGEYQIEEQVRAALSHQFPDRGFDQVVREVFKLVLERDCKRKALTERRARPGNGPAKTIATFPDAVKRAVWSATRDAAPGQWNGQFCDSTHRLEFDHDHRFLLSSEVSSSPCHRVEGSVR